MRHSILSQKLRSGKASVRVNFFPAKPARVGLAGLALTVTMASAYGQALNPPQAAGDTSATVLQPIVVQARKSRETEANVPESITVIDKERFENSPIDPMETIARNSPNVVWTNFSGDGGFFAMRGVSSLGVPTNNADGTVSFNIDGVPTSLIALSGNFVDIQDVEVLRGPQGTLWGASALGGAISLSSVPIDGERDIGFRAEVGNNGYSFGEAVAGGAIVPGVLNGRIAARFSNFNGDVSSLFTSDLDAAKLQSLRGGLSGTLDDGTTITLDTRYYHNDSNSPFFLVRGVDKFPISGTLTLPEDETILGSGILKIEHPFDAFRFTSTTGIQYNSNGGHRDATDVLLNQEQGLPPESDVSLPGYTYDKERIFSQEFRISSYDEDPVRWLVGTSLVYTDATREFLHPALPIVSDAGLNTYNAGLFGDVSVPVGERLTLGGGLRLNYDRTDAKYWNQKDFAPLEGRGSADETYLTGRASASYRLNEDLTAYASIARGHATNAFPLYDWAENGVAPSAYPASKGWTYEMGVKGRALNDRLELGLTGYYNRISDGVLNYLDPDDPSTFSKTFQNYDTKGFEFQMRALITDELSLVGGVGFTWAKIRGSTQGTEFKGRSIPNIPPWTVNAAVEYTRSLENLGLSGDFTTSVEYQYVSRRPADIDESFDLDSYNLVNLKTGWKSEDKTLEVYGFARNLTNERYELYGAYQGGGVDTVMVGRGRVAGIGISKKF